VAGELPLELKLAGLLHDAAEAYVSDLPKPVKILLPAYKDIEKTFEDLIALKFGVSFSDPRIKEADIAIAKREMSSPELFHNPLGRIDGSCLQVLDSTSAYRSYLRSVAHAQRSTA
jgi:hypothetical protein